ncbi:hypothetical protein [Pantoea sp. Aalb]|uniref:hypothetical protein n=1 Tax=Pantoea sp. Aalb TaxID=2576762 RepID=UPI00135CEE43|nr:hypothetical protein [Pantoea sp. Aalb]
MYSGVEYIPLLPVAAIVLLHRLASSAGIIKRRHCSIEGIKVVFLIFNGRVTSCFRNSGCHKLAALDTVSISK